jgi:hypothetical protein
MVLNDSINYIVSGLERSGTSMMMQILDAGGVPLGFDDVRKADESNVKGYFELEGGKIINRLMDNSFDFEKYRGRFIKITSFGLLYLSQGRYKIIYMQRNLEEILDSMQRMAGVVDDDRSQTKKSFFKLNEKVKKDIIARADCDVLFITYNDILKSPLNYLKQICQFVDVSEDTISKMSGAIDTRLYRQKR